MDRFIEAKLNPKYKLLLALKSNMDRFIDGVPHNLKAKTKIFKIQYG